MFTRLLRFRPPVNLSAQWSSSISILGKNYERDSQTNTHEKVISYLGRNVYEIPNHPISILTKLVHSHFGPTYDLIPARSSIISPSQNFDDLAFPQDHQGRQISESYYINKSWMLRTHTSAHEVEIFTAGYKRWLFTADVYRRDEIDASHNLVFHQMEGARLWNYSEMDALEEENRKLSQELARQDIIIEDTSNIGPENALQSIHDARCAELVAANLKHSLNGLIYKLFKGDDKELLKVRWINARFPLTSPSYEVEVFHKGKWLEHLGCGVVAQSTLDNSGIKNEIGWAFGLGLKRIAMVLFQTPDIRLFWSEDKRFIQQFEPNKITFFKPYSKYPTTVQDISFWFPLVPKGDAPLHKNGFCDIVREVAGDSVEDVKFHQIQPEIYIENTIGSV
ncbi:hypothetical protein M422DRAFT_224866 [Sphaerobolus stellatus SS14]|nr:hypothetical protein M422DRAFT_224866 [Sphaerobolus stellatus SS14]